MKNEKITFAHLSRKAIVYLRQSSVNQVYENRESTARQYNLKQAALNLGWDESSIVVIDEDLGQSGTSTEQRSGFQYMAEEIVQGRIGAIFVLEVSRLARSCSDWHRLLELCGMADAVIVDEHAVYDLKNYNDKLLLGLKGQFSEAEVYWMRMRTRGAALSKARRGELRFHPPTGFIWKEESGFDFHPDEQVCRAVQTVFERFKIDSSARAVTKYFHRNKLDFPKQQLNGEVNWGRASYRNIYAILKSPIYAGAYVYGRRKGCQGFVDGEIKKNSTTLVPMDSWLVNLRDAHPGYITWNEYLTNQHKLSENRTDSQKPEHRGPPREGAALLQGIVICGRCGRRMRIKYSGDQRWGYYTCDLRVWEEDGRSMCWSASAKEIDKKVEKLFLRTIRPPEIDLSLAVAHEVETQTNDVARQWRMSLERAQYEARQAERRYMAVDPENRLVASSLETAWNRKLRELKELEDAFEEVRRAEKLVLGDVEKEEILSLAKNLPKIWRAKSTTNAERKNLLRMLIEDVALEPIDIPKRGTRIRVMWKTGEVTEITANRLGPGQHIATPEQAIERIRELTKNGLRDNIVASQLNKEGIRSGTGNPWTQRAVGHVRRRNGIKKPKCKARPWKKLPMRREDGKYSARGVAEELGVPVHQVYYWYKNGQLTGTQKEPNGTLWFELNEKLIHRFTRINKVQ